MLNFRIMAIQKGIKTSNISAISKYNLESSLSHLNSSIANDVSATPTTSNENIKEITHSAAIKPNNTHRRHHSSIHISNKHVKHTVLKHHKEKFEEAPLLLSFFTYLSYTILQIFGNIRELLRKVGLDKRKGATDNCPSDFVPLYQSFDSFFTRNYYLRVRDVFNRPICSVPGAQIELLERKSNDFNWSYYFTGNKIKALNMGSYNYLGFAENNGPSSKEAIQSIHEYGVATCSARQELGTLKCQKYLESLLAKFIGVEASLTFGMGFATNVLNIPALVGKGCLILR